MDAGPRMDALARMDEVMDARNRASTPGIPLMDA